MQGIYTYIPETNHVPREYSIAAILSLLFMVPISLVPALALLYFYVSTLLLLLLLLLLMMMMMILRGGLKETENEIIAAYNQALQTKHHATKIV